MAIDNILNNNYGDYMDSYLQALGSTVGTGPSYAPSASSLPRGKLNREDFRKIHLKYTGAKHYFSYSFQPYQELCLEPCMNGFEVVVYGKNELLLDKVCTDLTKNIFRQRGKTKTDEKNLITRELQHGTLERSEEAWDKAVDIANKLLTQLSNTERIKRMGLKKSLPSEREEGGPATLPKGIYPYKNKYELDSQEEWNLDIKPAPMPTPSYKTLPDTAHDYPNYSPSVTPLSTTDLSQALAQAKTTDEDPGDSNPVSCDEASAAPNKMDQLLDKVDLQGAEIKHLRNKLAP